MSTFASFRRQAPKSSLRSVRGVAAAALDNEQITRQRVEQLETWAQLASLHMANFTQMGFWARLRWLTTGVCPPLHEPEQES